MIKIVAWNIQQGGGSRVSQICSALIESKSQIIALNEFKNNSKGEAIRSKLLQAGYFHQLVGPVKSDVNSVLIASKLPFDGSHFSIKNATFPGAIIRADFSAFSLFSMYLPHKKKHTLFDLVLEEMQENEQGIFVGDFNSGKQFIDQKGDSFWYSESFEKMEELDYVDAWRLKHDDTKEFSWYSHQGNGYRYDHIYVHKNIAQVVSSCDYEHAWRMRKLSDHSPMFLVLG